MLIINVIRLSWPFFKEMIIGKHSFSYALRKNKVKVIFFFAVMLSFIINWVFIPKMFTLSASYLEMEKELKACKETIAAMKDDKEAVNPNNEELIMLREKLKQYESNGGNKPDVAAGQKKLVKRDINYVSDRLK